MSTTRLTRNTDASHTVVGRQPSGRGKKPAIILLNRSSRFLRREYFRELVDAGYTEIISVETADNAYTVESLSIEFQQFRFILIDEPFNVGEAINLAMAYVVAESAIVLWSTMGVPQGVERAAETLRKGSRRVCVVPLLRGERNDPLPTMHAPAFHKRTLKIIDLPVRGAGEEKTISPFDYVGLYSRGEFVRVGGYDGEINHNFWQRLDFGFRTYLTGGDIPCVPTFRIAYKSTPEPEDRTLDEGYARFFAKNLIFRLTSQGIKIPLAAVIRFVLRSRLGVVFSLRVFAAARVWLTARSGDIRIDPRDLVDRWSVNHE